jgi:hypothetical protein
MKGLLLGLLFATSHLSPVINSSMQSSDWKLNGELAGQCVLATFGNVRDERGAQLAIHCDASDDDNNITGSVTMKLLAANLQYKRITVTADMEQGNGLSPTLWIKSLHDNQTILFDSDVEQSLMNANNSSAQRVLSTVVARDATAVSVGLMLHGKGAISLRNVRVIFSNEGDIAPQAQTVLDSALQLIRQHGVHARIDWALLDTQAQHYAAGAQNSAEVYPVIRFVLQQLGDQRGMVLTPEVSQMLNQHRAADTSTHVKFFALPDGAELVLGADAIVDRRIADR